VHIIRPPSLSVGLARIKRTLEALKRGEGRLGTVLEGKVVRELLLVSVEAVAAHNQGIGQSGRVQLEASLSALGREGVGLGRAGCLVGEGEGLGLGSKVAGDIGELDFQLKPLLLDVGELDYPVGTILGILDHVVCLGRHLKKKRKSKISPENDFPVFLFACLVRVRLSDIKTLIFP
jgi:hypothetical protein